MTQPVQTVRHEDLVEVLAGLPPLELVGVMLLRQYRATGALPRDTPQLGAATRQLRDYTRACEQAAEQLAKLGPVAANDAALVEAYPL